MHRKLVYISFFVFTGLFVNQNILAQDYYSGDLRFGLGVAPNLAWYDVSTNPYSSNGARLGWSWGLNVDYFFTSNYAFSTGLQILNYGGKLQYPDLILSQTGQNLSVKSESDVRLNSLQIPFALKMRTSMVSVINYYGKFGVTGNINFSRSEDYRAFQNGNEIFKAEDRDFEDGSRLFNLSLLVGAGAEYTISGSTHAYAGITYNQGFLNQINKNAYLTDNSGVVIPSEQVPQGPSGDDQKATIRFINLELGVFF